ncbi:unnamed protein product [Diamesa hyperborea]
MSRRSNQNRHGGRTPFNQRASHLRETLQNRYATTSDDIPGGSENQAGSSERQDDAPGYERHPSHLRGRDIGFFYATRNIKKKAESVFLNGPNLSLSDDKISQISEAIDNEIINSTRERNSQFRQEFQKHLSSDFSERLFKSSADQFDSASSSNERLYEEFIAQNENPSYVQMQAGREGLPSFNHKNEILELLKLNQVILIKGNTGTGKTTQVPQYILDDALLNKRGSQCRIICTQPRRIAAISISERVATERGEDLGTSCGYQIRLEKVKPRDDGNILFCTTGVLTKFMESNPAINTYSHIIIDEIHERNVQTDMCLGLIKQIIEHRKDLKVILMSATLKAEQFSKYFHNCPMIHIEGFTFKVKEIFLEDILEETGYNDFKPNMKKRYDETISDYDAVIQPYVSSLSGRYSRKTIETLRNPQTENIDVDFIENLILHICYNKLPGAILVILPGFGLISRLYNLMTTCGRYPTSSFVIHTLHSMLTGNDQCNIFARPPNNSRKIIISTPLAETSITIEDVVYVVNAGKFKKPYFDFEKNANVLEDQWITTANETQRKGRAGRVQEGFCYHLYTKARSHNFLPFEEPEILRIRLEEVVLSIKVLCIKDVKSFMQTLIDVPKKVYIDKGIELLQRLGALTENETLTPLGLHLAKLSVHPQIGKMLLFSTMLSCVEPIATVCASLSFKSPFYTVIGKDDQYIAAKRKFSIDSDQLAASYAMNEWQNRRNHNFCHQNFLSYTILIMLEKMKKQFSEMLYYSKFLKDPKPDHQENNHHSENEKLLKGIICCGLYPNIAFRTVRIAKRYQRCSIRTVERQVNLLPSSVNNEPKESVDSGYMVYHELQKFNMGYFILETTANIPPYAIALFGDRIKTNIHENGTHYISVGDIAKFKCNPETAALIMDLREGLNKLMEKKIEEPSPIKWDADEGRLMKAIIELISTDNKYEEDEDDNMNERY